MEPTVTSTPPKSSQDLKTLAHLLDRIDRSVAEVRDDAKVGGLLQDAASQPDVAPLQPDLARPRLHEMADSDLDEIRPSLGKRASRGLVRFLIVFSIGVGATLAWQWYGDSARATWPQPTSLAAEPTSVPQVTAAAPQATASPELQQLKEDLAQVKQELQQLKEIPSALASLRQSVDQLAGSQQQVAGTIAKLAAQKPASPPRPAPAVKPLTPPSAPKHLTPPSEVR
jgi:hypothetical protein